MMKKEVLVVLGVIFVRGVDGPDNYNLQKKYDEDDKARIRAMIQDVRDQADPKNICVYRDPHGRWIEASYVRRASFQSNGRNVEIHNIFFVSKKDRMFERRSEEIMMYEGFDHAVELSNGGTETVDNKRYYLFLMSEIKRAENKHRQQH